MKTWGARGLLILLVWTMLGLSVFLVPALLQPVSAEEMYATTVPTPGGPDRFKTVTVMATFHEWWLIQWSDNQVQCRLNVAYEGLPRDNNIYNQCGADLYNLWKKKSWACNEVDTTLCKGFYWQHIQETQREVEQPRAIPPARVWISLEDCASDPIGWCTLQPRLILRGVEPLADHRITHIEGVIGTNGFRCDGDECHFRLAQTGEKGIKITFWAYSSFGDTSEVFDALVRVISSGTDNRLQPKYFVDVISLQWRGRPNATCSHAWQSFPPIDGLPAWLNTPDEVSALESDVPYQYLATKLIKSGAVNVEACEDGGLLPNGAASACGREAAEVHVQEWQNQFDQLIYDVAVDTKVPAQLIKNLFSRESQFWPGAFEGKNDVGLGQLTEKGADTTLMWNPTFYSEFCPTVLNANLCKTHTYALQKDAKKSLSDEQKAILRGALLQRVNASCADCPLGIDTQKANDSVAIFARTLLANCEQAGQIVKNVTGYPAGEMMSYEDLWKLTLANYNGGAGCMADALQIAAAVNEDLTWDAVSKHFSEGCKPVADYVEAISSSP